MTVTQKLIGLIPVAYVIGSIPFGLIVGRMKGIDPRKAGSGNIGATNLGRLLGLKYFLLVFFLDMLKGAVPTLAAGAVLHFHAGDRLSCLLWVLVGFGAFLGHMFSLFLKFKGGKGVATSLGYLLGIYPYFTAAGVAALAVWLLVLWRTRYISVASITAAMSLPMFYVVSGAHDHWPLLGAQLPMSIFALLVPALIIIKHRANFARLRAGTENRVGKSL